MATSSHVKLALFKIENEVLLNLDIAMKKKIGLYQLFWIKYINLGTQLARGEEKFISFFSKIFHCGALLLYVVLEVFVEVPLFQETWSAPKKSWLRACNSHPKFSS